jgi:class 3 adenylate cyclase
MDEDVEKEKSNEEIMIGRRNVKVERARNTNRDNDTDNGIRKTIVDKMMDGGNDTFGHIEHVRRSSSHTENKEIFDLQTLLTQRQDRIWSVLHERYKYNTSIKRGQNFLLNHFDSKLSLIVMYADLVGSTKMSMNLPVEKMAKIIKAYSHEISSVVESYEGFVLKYVGDAVIAFFHVGFNKYLACDKSFQCAKSMIDVIDNGINPIFEKDGYPELAVKIGIDEGENVAIQYGFDKSAPIDLIGYPMNVAAKMTSLTGPNKISVGNNVFKLLHPSLQTQFHPMPLDENQWKYIDHENNSLYKVHTI